MISSNGLSRAQFHQAQAAAPIQYFTPLEDVTLELADGRLIQVAVEGVPQPYLEAVNNNLIENAPFVPLNLVAEDITDTGFTATWDALSGATSYELDVAVGPTFEEFVEGFEALDTEGEIEMDVTGLTAETTYYWRVRAVVEGQVWDSSDAVETETDEAA